MNCADYECARGLSVIVARCCKTVLVNGFTMNVNNLKDVEAALYFVQTLLCVYSRVERIKEQCYNTSITSTVSVFSLDSRPLMCVYHYEYSSSLSLLVYIFPSHGRLLRPTRLGTHYRRRCSCCINNKSCIRHFHLFS